MLSRAPHQQGKRLFFLLVAMLLLGASIPQAHSKSSDQWRLVKRAYVVKKDESLYSLSKRLFGSSEHWKFLRKTNPNLRGIGPQSIVPAGSKLTVVYRKRVRVAKKSKLKSTQSRSVERSIASEKMVADPDLEKRLEVSKTYRSESGDSLESLARLLYGHSTWWKRLKKLNPKTLRKYGPKSKLRVGTEITYLAPKIGSEYTVQPGDWLLRIAIWKFNDKEALDQVLAINSDVVKDPNLIQPGDRLFFSDEGSIALQKKESQSEPEWIVQKPSIELQSAPKASPVDRFVASSTMPAEIAWISMQSVHDNILPFSIGFTLMMFFLMSFKTLKRRVRGAFQASREHPRLKDEVTQSMEIDPSLVRKDDDQENRGDDDTGPKYQHLLKRWWIKYLKRRSPPK